MQSYKYVIVGGGLTGGRACQGIRRVDKEGSVALIAAEEHLPYERPALSKGYLTGKEGLDHVTVKEKDYYAQNQIDLLQGVRVTQIDRAAHNVTLDDGRTLGYEKLLLATGGHAWRLPIPGSDLSGVYTLRTIEDSDAIRRAAAGGKRALVLGGSFIGSEVAASLAQLGAQVTMVFPEARLLERVVPEELSSHLLDLYAAHGVHILSRTKPQRLEGNTSVGRAVLDNAETLDVDLVVMGVGIRLNTALAQEAGLEMGERGAVVVDETLRTSDPDIYAAGDIAAWPDPTYGKRLRVDELEDLRFEPPDEERFPSIGLCREAVVTGGTLPAVLNAANEVAVASFLTGNVSFPGITHTIRQVMEMHTPLPDPDLGDLLEASGWAEQKAGEVITSLAVER